MTEHSPITDHTKATTVGLMALFDDEKGEKTILVPVGDELEIDQGFFL